MTTSTARDSAADSPPVNATGKVDWVRVPVEKKVLDELTQRSDIRGFIQTGGHLGLLLLTGFITFYVLSNYSWWYVIPCLYVHGSVFAMLGAGIHELSHERVFESSFLNDFFNKFINLINWQNPYYFKFSHMIHHRFTVHYPEDQEVVLPQQIANLFPEIILSSNGYYTVKNCLFQSLGIATTDLEKHLYPQMSEKELKELRRFSQLTLLFHFVVAAFSIVSGHWILLLLITFPKTFGSLLVQLTHMPQHVGLVSGSNDFRLNCRTYRSNFLVEYLYWNMNFHIEHHMHAAVPCYNLPKLHKYLKADLPHIHPNLFKTWVEILYIADRQVRDPSYEYYQQIPGQESFDKKKASLADQVVSAQDSVLSSMTNEELAKYKIWECTICGFIYDEAKGDPEEGLAPGTRWDDIPDDWSCPDCGVAKSDFDMMERKETTNSNDSAVEQGSDALIETGNKESLVIVGSGLAGYQLAAEVRKHSPDQPITLITRDGGESYSKPMLSNALRAKKKAKDLVLKEATAMAESLSITVKVNVEVLDIVREDKKVVTDQGDFHYGKLILALGADPIKLAISGSGASDVISVNDLKDYVHYEEKLVSSKKIVILGAGLIGCEFANDLVESGYQVEVVDLAHSPMPALLPAEVGLSLMESLANLGVEWHFNRSITQVDRHGGSYVCTLDNGDEIDADLVLSAVGIRPRIALAKSSGVVVSKGIVVDGFLKTSDPDIYSLGDSAEISGKVLPFILPIRHCVKSLAKTVIGRETKVDFPLMPIVVKTSALPIVLLPVDPGVAGKWIVENNESGIVAIFESECGEALGFVLTGDAVEQRDALLQQISRKKLTLVEV